MRGGPERNIVLCRPMRWHGEGVEPRASLVAAVCS